MILGYYILTRIVKIVKYKLLLLNIFFNTNKIKKTSWDYLKNADKHIF